MQYSVTISDAEKRIKSAELKLIITKNDSLTLLKIQNIGTLRIYKKKKGASIDYSQIPAHFKQRIMDIVEPIKQEKVLGIDESGKGDYFGPLVIAGAYVKEPHRIRALGVMDSKRLNDEKILKLAKEIKKHCLINVVKIGPQRYNEMYAQVKNLNKLLAWGHSTVIELPLGAGENVKIAAKQFIKQNGMENLVKVAKLHFKVLD